MYPWKIYQLYEFLKIKHAKLRSICPIFEVNKAIFGSKIVTFVPKNDKCWVKILDFWVKSQIFGVENHNILVKNDHFWLKIMNSTQNTTTFMSQITKIGQIELALRVLFLKIRKVDQFSMDKKLINFTNF